VFIRESFFIRFHLRFALSKKNYLQKSRHFAFRLQRLPNFLKIRKPAEAGLDPEFCVFGQVWGKRVETAAGRVVDP
jgi:hypothetical protein